MGTLEACGARCASLSSCKAFGFWTGTRHNGHCALYSSACGGCVRIPVWENNAYNMCRGTSTPTPAPTPAPTLSYICDQSNNFVNGAQYDQISLTSACPNCSSNPVYGPPNSVDEAVAWCKSQCDQRSSCSGFFFQRHMNGHEICGFYTGFDPVDASAKAWHGHAGGSQLCAKVPV